jgi:hypothetical protein
MYPTEPCSAQVRARVLQPGTDVHGSFSVYSECKRLQHTPEVSKPHAPNKENRMAYVGNVCLRLTCSFWQTSRTATPHSIRTMHPDVEVRFGPTPEFPVCIHERPQRVESSPAYAASCALRRNTEGCPVSCFKIA